MVSSLVVSLSLVVFLISPIGGAQSFQTAKVPAAWSKISPEVGVISTPSGKVLGVAVVIDASGLMVASPGVDAPTKVDVQLAGPIKVTATRVGYDPVTGLVAYKPNGWHGTHAFARVATGNLRTDEMLIAATPSGPVNGQASSSFRAAQLNTSTRFVPVSEVKFERTLDRITGAALFNSDGELVGLLGATLSAPTAVKQSRAMGGGGGLAKPMGAAPENHLQDYGPEGVTTAYVLGTPVLARVVEGFRSENHVVRHPTLGVNFRDEHGVMVTKVSEGSGAKAAGIQVGDKIISLDGETVKSSVVFAARLFGLKIGSTTSLIYERGGKSYTVNVKVGG